MGKGEIEEVGGTEVSFTMPDTESIGKLKDMKPNFSLNLRYKTQEDWHELKGKPVRAYYMGIREIPNENGEMIRCGLFVSPSECFISGQMLLVEAVEKLPMKTPVEITYQGKKKNVNTDGSHNVFDVFTLGDA
jgi:hypothetical protein